MISCNGSAILHILFTILIICHHQYISYEHAHTCVWVCVSVHLHVCVCAGVWVYVYIVCLCMCAHTCLNECACTCVCVWGLSMCVHMHACFWICVKSRRHMKCNVSPLTCLSWLCHIQHQSYFCLQPLHSSATEFLSEFLCLLCQKPDGVPRSSNDLCIKLIIYTVF